MLCPAVSRRVALRPAVRRGEVKRVNRRRTVSFRMVMCPVVGRRVLLHGVGKRIGSVRESSVESCCGASRGVE
jgi:hypothetical protein